MFPQKSYVEALTPNGMVFGGEAFGRRSGLDEVVGLCWDQCPGSRWLALCLSVPTTEGYRWNAASRSQKGILTRNRPRCYLDFGRLSSTVWRPFKVA